MSLEKKDKHTVTTWRELVDNIISTTSEMKWKKEVSMLDWG